ncbi:MAG TPA: ATP synthase F0 subunit B [Verrucomicrobiae bacterium]|nr:ATP synthase F0 subunit B [Verrucomicrobiae bacterium]
MAATLHALGGILLNAIPTFIILLIVFAYLKWMYFKPMAKVLHDRYELTEGARKMAEESMQRAAAKSADYDRKLHEARAETYKAQERLYKELQDRQAADLAAAREQAEKFIREARESLAQDAAAAQASLSQQSDLLASQIADSLLRRSAA